MRTMLSAFGTLHAYHVDRSAGAGYRASGLHERWLEAAVEPEPRAGLEPTAEAPPRDQIHSGHRYSDVRARGCCSICKHKTLHLV